MANTTDDRIRARIIEYADTTPEPPVMSRAGIVTTGCPRCHRTAWRQHDAEGPVWVCASCGHVEGVIVKCPHCEIPMTAPPLGAPDRWRCPRCPRVAATGESALNIEERERQRVAALAALDEAIAARAEG
ncbi:hypothetical protein SMD11_4792 [Streptomyces albireticuli]|uniref:Uncharacterized protein n=2 Tax=Streptomyces TaxID=1883 RepID=A0A1Z2L7W6_9ACTN|nr:hypothetical protein SMD11_4792 [Streptomyces albireticuli]